MSRERQQRVSGTEPETLERAVGRVRPGETLLLNGAGSFPMRFAEQVVAAGLRDITLIHPMRRAGWELAHDYVDPEMADRFFHISEFTFDEAIRRAIRQGRATFRPNHPHQATETLEARGGTYTFVSSASPPDRHGWFSLGSFGGWGIPWARSSRAERIILEVNRNQPRVHGSVCVHASEVECWYEVNYPLTAEASAPEASATEAALADNVCELIPDAATLQIGAGSVPDQIAKRLVNSGKRHLGVHSEGLFDSVVELIEAGVIDNSRKSLHPGMTVIALSLGSERLYRFLDDNPEIEMRSMAYVNDPFVIARNERQVAINGAVQVDLHGQCSSESIGPRHYSGTGGQWEFIYGAGHARDGRGIIVLGSMTSRGMSRIVSGLPPGTPVTIPRNDVQYVVTEYGVASLRGKTMAERARELIAIAHPEVRDRLLVEARDAQLI